MIHRYQRVPGVKAHSEIALFLLPPSSNLVRLSNISTNDNVLDVACGTGNTAITAARRKGVKVTGIDFTPEMLIQAKAESSLAGVYDIEWKEGNVEDLPFEDNSFDVVLSIFGHMFAPHPEVAIREILRVTKSGGRIAFATWLHELANGRMFEAMAKHIMMPFAPNNSQTPPSPTTPPFPMQWGIPEVVKKRLGADNNVKNIHFERGVVNIPVLSPNHYWKMLATTSGPIIAAIETLKEDPQEIESLRKDILQAIAPYVHDNVLNLDYLIMVATKA